MIMNCNNTILLVVAENVFLDSLGGLDHANYIPGRDGQFHLIRFALYLDHPADLQESYGFGSLFVELVGYVERSSLRANTPGQQCMLQFSRVVLVEVGSAIMPVVLLSLSGHKLQGFFHLFSYFFVSSLGP